MAVVSHLLAIFQYYVADFENIILHIIMTIKVLTESITYEFITNCHGL